MKRKIAIYPVTQEFIIKLAPEKQLPRKVSFYIIAGEKLHLIDSGTASALDKIYPEIIRLGYKTEDIVSLFLTHSHPDHIGGALSIVNATHCSVYAHHAEIPWIENTSTQYKERPVPGFHELVEGGIIVNISLKENTVISPEPGMTIETYHTPGHSPGSTSYFLKETGTLFSGDALIFPGELPIFTDGRELLQTINLIKNIQGLKTIHPAWGTTIHEADIKTVLENCAQYVLKIKNCVQNALSLGLFPENKQFCPRILTDLGFPEYLANPLIEKSFVSLVDG